MGTAQQKRKQSAIGDEHAKKQRPSQFNGAVAVAATPLQGTAANATATPYPMAGVNGVAANWSTAAALGAAGRAAASPPPVMAGANGPAMPLVLVAMPAGLQAPGAPSNAAAPAPPMAGVHGVAANWSTAAALGAASRAAALPPPVKVGAYGPAMPVVLVPVRAGLQAPAAPSNAAAPAPPMAGADGVATALVAVPVDFFFYKFTAPTPAPGVGTKLTAALATFRSSALASMLTALMPSCNPPLPKSRRRTGAPPPWWPTASEHWWFEEVVAPLGQIQVDARAPVPFLPINKLKKAQKVAVLVAIVKHLTPNFVRITNAMNRCGRLSDEEAALWNSWLQNELPKHYSPAFILQPLQQLHSDGNRLAAGAEGDVHGGVVATDDSREQAVNLPVEESTHLLAAVTSSSADDGRQVAAAEPEIEQHGSGHQVAAELEPQPEQHNMYAIDVAAAEQGALQLEEAPEEAWDWALQLDELLEEWKMFKEAAQQEEMPAPEDERDLINDEGDHYFD